MDEHENKEHWHLDRRVPLALIIAIFLQTAGVFYWGGQVETRVTNLEAQVSKNTTMSERLSRVEEGVSWIKTTLTDIKGRLD